MNRRNVLTTLLSMLPISMLLGFPKEQRTEALKLRYKKTTTILPPQTPLRVTQEGDQFKCRVSIENLEGEIIGYFNVRYDQRTKLMGFELKSHGAEEVICHIHSGLGQRYSWTVECDQSSKVKVT